MPEFMLDDGYTGIIRAADLHDAATEMARKLGIRGEIRTMVGKWDTEGQITGWTKKSKAGNADVLLEVFVSKLDDESREFDRFARAYQALLDENAELKRRLASGMEAATAGETPKSGSTEGDSPVAKPDAQKEGH
jgi:hypothetical protein